MMKRQAYASPRQPVVRAFKGDNLLKYYVNKPFGRLHKAMRQLEIVMLPVFQAAPGDATVEKKTYLPIATHAQIKAMLGNEQFLITIIPATERTPV